VKKKIDKRILLIILMSGISSSMIVVINFLFLQASETLFITINILAAMFLAFPIVMYKYSQYGKKKQMEEIFPIFLRDFVESIRGGMPVPEALKSLRKNDYKALNPYVKKMAAQMDWGIPVEKVFLKFSNEVKSKLIARVIYSVIESHRFGGNLADTFEALSNTSFEVEKLKEERKLYLNSQMMTGYIIFFVFLAVMIGLGRFLVPMLGGNTAGALTGEQTISCTTFLTQADCNKRVDARGQIQCHWDTKTQGCQSVLINEYKNLFMVLIFVQGLFAGLSVGKMAEGSVFSGVKHSLLMVFAGVLIFAILG
jgi:flagellar protein FlaJ